MRNIYVIKFVSDLRQVGGFLQLLRFLHQYGNKGYRHNITEIRLKVALNTITLTSVAYAIHTCRIFAEWLFY